MAAVDQSIVTTSIHHSSELSPDYTAFCEPESSTSKCRLTASGRDTRLILRASYCGAGGVAEGQSADPCSCVALAAPIIAMFFVRAAGVQILEGVTSLGH